jgi:hypothetical protein
MNRREFSQDLLGLVFSAGLPALGLVVSGDKWERKLNALVNDYRALRSIREGVLRYNANDEVFFANNLISRLGGKRLIELSSSRELQDKVNELIQQDFRSGQTVIIEGNLVALTECMLCRFTGSDLESIT